MRFRALVFKAGAVPPEAGPARDAWLEEEGTAQLNLAHQGLQETADALGDLWSRLPSTFVTGSAVSDGVEGDFISRRDQWNSVVMQVGSALLAKLEPTIRRAERNAVNAYNYLEDHARAEEAHQLIHRTGALRSGLYGCPVTLENESFVFECLTRASHLRIGFSAGVTAAFNCSLCDQPEEDCDHIAGKIYESVVTRTDGRCNLCGEMTCAHVVGTTHRKKAELIARSAAAREVSIVRRPRYPDARLDQVSVPVEAIGAEREELTDLVDAAAAGTLQCDVCLGSCVGMSEAGLWDKQDEVLSGDLAPTPS